MLFTDGNAELKRTIPEATRATTPYFSKAVFEETEEAFYATLDYMTEILEELEPPASPNRFNDLSYSRTTTYAFPLSNLPTIQLPPFDGDVDQWEQFRDRFSAVIINNRDLTDYARIHYLVSSLRGSALDSISDLAIVADNFAVAWQTLRDRYDNKRRLLETHLNTLLNLPQINRESHSELQALRGLVKKTIASLYNVQNNPSELWQAVVVHVVTQSFDPITLKSWTLRLPDDIETVSFETLDLFIAARIRALEDVARRSSKKKALEDISRNSGNRSKIRSCGAMRTHNALSASSSKPSCPICGAQHYFNACPQFTRCNSSQRRELVKRHRRCFNCLSQNHNANECGSKYCCRICQKRHHSLLHLDVDADAVTKREIVTPGTSSQSKESPPELHASLTSNCTTKRTPVLLATARVKVTSSSGRSTVVRVLLDQGSEITLVSERLAQCLRAKRFRMPISISAVGCVNAGNVRHAVDMHISPLSSSSISFAITGVILQNLTTYIPLNTIDSAELSHLTGIPWADPEPLNGDSIDIILGADIYTELLRNGVRKGARGQPVAQETALGWIISGPTGRIGNRLSSTRAFETDVTTCDVASVSLCISSPSLETELKRFWELETVPAASRLTPEEQRCEEHFLKTHSRNSDGRYRVRLPFKTNVPIAIGASRYRAERSLISLIRRLRDKPAQWSSYCEFLREYHKLGHMRPARESIQSENPVVFIPHHPVLREQSSTTRLRVVFNASSPTSNGLSLNDNLLAGPKLQIDLSAVIMRWRYFRYVYCADVEKMYRQILIDERDVDYQRILWSESLLEKPKAFQLLTVTYGMSCAPFLALRVLQQLNHDEGGHHPLASPILTYNTYVDDVLFGGDSVHEAILIRNQLIELLQRGGFNLRKWSANNADLLTAIHEDSNEDANAKNLAEDESIKILGVRWIPSDDTFCINSTLPNDTPRSKRAILSTIAKLYDPLGWVTPVTIAAKIFMQELWKHSINWDEVLSEQLLCRWNKLFLGFSALDGFRVPRWTGFTGDDCQVELHGFADASNSAYAAVIYCKVISRSHESTVSLLTGKSRVAPIKPCSIPRLELSAALLLAQLMEFAISTWSRVSITYYCWSDSTVVLTWIANHSSKWKVFVANRVADIHNRVPNAHWRYVPTQDNPADCASRGLLGTELLNHSLWWHGPLWLCRSADEWPRNRAPDTDTAWLEEKSVASNTSQLTQPCDLFSRLSSWPKLIRVTAYIFRFVSACRRSDNNSYPLMPSSRAITAGECDHARIVLIKMLQATMFKEEITLLVRHEPLPKRSTILSLSPFLDRDGILRVGGRITRSPHPFNKRHPMLLSSHRLTGLIIDNCHLRSLHGGVQLTLNLLRRDYWAIRARSLIRQRIHQCVVCVRERAATPTQLMGNLPRERVSATERCFAHCGLDYAGPVLVRASAGRGSATRKSYIALFICLATRAVHLEVVGDYSTKAFINAFDRFSARRGLPRTIYSDNGTNFVGADREMTAAFRAALRDSNFQNRTATDGIHWRFIPPAAPHFGGVWEAGIKSVKHHMRRVLQNHTLTFEELTTLLCRIEACLNSRPIAPMSDSIEDYEPLTPGHFLVGSSIMTHPEPSLLDINQNRLTRWQLVQQMNERFWRLWYDDYINSLQQRSKWRTTQPQIREGQLVLIRNSNLPPCKWDLGRIIKSHPGLDGLIRVVTVRTTNSELTRPISKVCVLPVDCSTSNNSTERAD